MSTTLTPITPGEILLLEFMEPMGISQNQLARDLDMPLARVNDIIHGRRGITANTALRFAAYFKSTAEFWLNLQSAYDLKQERSKFGASLTSTIRPYKFKATQHRRRPVKTRLRPLKRSGQSRKSRVA